MKEFLKETAKESLMAGVISVVSIVCFGVGAKILSKIEITIKKDSKDVED